MGVCYTLKELISTIFIGIATGFVICYLHYRRYMR
jgi:hypothetical protein